jgi:hypothetical protein
MDIASHHITLQHSHITSHTCAFSASVIASSLAASIIIATFPLSAALGVPGSDRVPLFTRREGVWREKELPARSLEGTMDPWPERRGEICDDTTRVLCLLLSERIERESLNIPGSVTLGPGRPGNIPSSSLSPSMSSPLSLLLLRLLWFDFHVVSSTSSYTVR